MNSNFIPIYENKNKTLYKENVAGGGANLVRNKMGSTCVYGWSHALGDTDIWYKNDMIAVVQK